ncbi:hypothetical protein [Nocardia higoensis]|uniref:hypothetical protein n=1 Tax=Nocardia higoensis TaxID=228599 RepID=UPI0002DB8030|nr:hypothetical protein [Nocardia higoensis]
MAELRSSRRRTQAADDESRGSQPGADEGRHHSGDDQSVSVDELLRRQDDED